MASVVLPTVRWTSDADAFFRALRDGDELLVVCDSPDGPVDDAPDRATVLVAGEPAGCSGTAHALATGMERATDDVVVWTDDDVSREGGWFDRLVGPAAVPVAARDGRTLTVAAVPVGENRRFSPRDCRTLLGGRKGYVR